MGDLPTDISVPTTQILKDVPGTLTTVDDDKYAYSYLDDAGTTKIIILCMVMIKLLIFCWYAGIVYFKDFNCTY